MQERAEIRGSVIRIAFIIVAKGLNNMIRKAEQEGLLSELPGTPRTTFINLQYADNT